MGVNNLTLNQTVSQSVSVGSPVSYELDLNVSAKMAVTFDGLASQLGVYGPFPDGSTLVPGTGNGFLRLCGNVVVGRTFPAGRILLYVSTSTSDIYTLQVRPWTFWDNVLDLLYYRWFRKSSC